MVTQKSPGTSPPDFFVTILLSAAAAVFYFFRLFSHIRIMSSRKFAMTPARTEVRSAIGISKDIKGHLLSAAGGSELAALLL